MRRTAQVWRNNRDEYVGISNIHAKRKNIWNDAEETKANCYTCWVPLISIHNVLKPIHEVGYLQIKLLQQYLFKQNFQTYEFFCLSNFLTQFVAVKLHRSTK